MPMSTSSNLESFNVDKRAATDRAKRSHFSQLIRTPPTTHHSPPQSEQASKQETSKQGATMPRPPRLLLLPPASLRTPASPKASRSRSRIRLHGPDGIGKRRPRSTYAGGNTSGFPPAGPNLAWLAGEIKRLAFPAPSPALHTPAAAAAAAAAVPHSSSQQRQPPPPPQYAHHPAFFPTPVFPLRSRDITFLGEPREFYETILERIRGATSRVTLSALYLGTGELVRVCVCVCVCVCACALGQGQGLDHILTYTCIHTHPKKNKHAHSLALTHTTGAPAGARAGRRLSPPPRAQGPGPPRPLQGAARGPRAGFPLDAGAPAADLPSAGRGGCMKIRVGHGVSSFRGD